MEIRVKLLKNMSENKKIKLAKFTGIPCFSEKIYVGRPFIPNKDIILHRIENAIDSKWLTNDGPFVKQFEKKISEKTGAKNSIAICNATIALEIAIKALELKGEVIIPSFTFIATAHSLMWQGITPVFCDIKENSFNIDPEKIIKLITPKTTGIIGVHVWGIPCDIYSLDNIAKHYKLKLMFDAAHAFGNSYNNYQIGNFGELEVFSFHATKFINSFEGGGITTNNDELAEKIRLMRNFGFKGLDNVVYLGTNGKMNEISAAMGLTSLEFMDEIIEKNKNNYFHYKKYLSDIKGLRIMKYPELYSGNYQYIVLQIDENEFGISRDLLVDILHAENIIARKYFYPGCHNMEPYKSLFPNSKILLPETENVIKQVICLPTGIEIDEEKIEKICGIIKYVKDNSDQIINLSNEK
jgi:dTDP-4-amino-4,6-dideoxygalactose transaminase